MPKSKFLIGVLLAMLLLATQAFYVGAAPASQEGEGTSVTGNVDGVLVEVDPETDAVTIVLTYSSEVEGSQTVRLSLETALGLGLVVEDTENPGSYIVPEEIIGSEIKIDPATVLLEEGEKEHPVGSAVSDFFSELLGVDYDTVMAYHDEGVGFGVIAQALWMTNALEGDTTMFSTILDAKRSGDYSLVTLADGSTPKNWGQFRKAVMADRDKSKENLGAIMSGRADKDSDGASGKSVIGKGSSKSKGSDKSQGSKGLGKDNNKGKKKDKKK